MLILGYGRKDNTDIMMANFDFVPKDAASIGRKVALFSLMALALLLESCAPAATGSRKSELTKLRVNIQPYLSFAPFFIAKEEGYFEEQHLQVEFVQLRNSLEDVLALNQGKLDVFGDVITTGLISTIARGGEIKIVADKGYLPASGCASVAILARRQLIEDGKLKNPQQLRGLRVYFPQPSATGYIGDKLLLSAGLTLDNILYVKVPSAAASEALKRNTLDLIITSEPWATRIIREGSGILWMPAARIAPEFQFAVVAYGKKLLHDDPDAGRRFMHAYLKAVRKYNEGKTARNLEILAQYTKLDKELLTAACWMAMRSDGWVNTQSLLEFQSWAAKKGLLDYSATENQLWDPRFIQYVKQNP
jgi:NitT/TauT family transport system substrate-binding protein